VTYTAQGGWTLTGHASTAAVTCLADEGDLGDCDTQEHRILLDPQRLPTGFLADVRPHHLGTRRAASTVSETRHKTTLGARRTRQRLEILQHLSASPDFISAQGLHARLARSGTLVGLSTVYRALRDLERTEQVDVVRGEASGERLYRKRSTTGHQHYVICRRCGRSEAVDTEIVERWASHLDQLTGFSNVTHTLELSGECMDCHL